MTEPMTIKLAQWQEKNCTKEGVPACAMCLSNLPEHAAARERAFGDADYPCPFGRKRALRGVGDVIAAVTTTLGIKACPGCKKRRKALNKALPFK